MTLIDRQPPSHWYLRTGEPFYELPKSDGTGMRPVTLRDARAALAFPSVTNVLSVLAKPGLDAWRIEQGIMAALTLPRRADEALDAFAKRVVTDMGQQVVKAADFGTGIHAACELYARQRIAPTDAALLPFFVDWQRWFDQEVVDVLCVEEVLVSHEFGYAGRVDMIAKLRSIGWAVVDFKTQKVKRTTTGEPKPAFYETWPLQLAAYRDMAIPQVAAPIDALVSIVIDSAQPGPIHLKTYDNPRSLFAMFHAALALWKYVKSYDPVALRGLK